MAFNITHTVLAAGACGLAGRFRHIRICRDPDRIRSQMLRQLAIYLRIGCVAIGIQTWPVFSCWCLSHGKPSVWSIRFSGCTIAERIIG